MTILDQIVEYKKKEVESCKELIPVKDLENTVSFSRSTFSMKSFLSDPALTGIIAEFKRQSPSKGIINDHSLVEEVTTGYASAGASALSVLTDFNFFGGSNDDIIKARTLNQLPILRKDFTIDEYQITEAKAIGADAILLIAAILSPRECLNFAEKAHDLGLEVLLEIHNSEELKCCNDYVDMVGVNNRDLKTFAVDLNRSAELAALIPGNFLKIAESGITSIEDIRYLKQQGFNGFLIGESFMKYPNPVLAFTTFVEPIKKNFSL
jgi:indole-3-glycerol phosphate synthase